MGRRLDAAKRPNVTDKEFHSWGIRGQVRSDGALLAPVALQQRHHGKPRRRIVHEHGWHRLRRVYLIHGDVTPRPGLGILLRSEPV